MNVENSFSEIIRMIYHLAFIRIMPKQLLKHYTLRGIKYISLSISKTPKTNQNAVKNNNIKLTERCTGIHCLAFFITSRLFFKTGPTGRLLVVKFHSENRVTMNFLLKYLFNIEGN